MKYPTMVLMAAGFFAGAAGVVHGAESAPAFPQHVIGNSQIRVLPTAAKFKGERITRPSPRGMSSAEPTSPGVTQSRYCARTFRFSFAYSAAAVAEAAAQGEAVRSALLDAPPLARLFGGPELRLGVELVKAQAQEEKITVRNSRLVACLPFGAGQFQ